MAFPRKLNDLCSPALVYFGFSIIMIVGMVLQNLESNTQYTLGCFTCSVPNTIVIFALKIMYVLFWTWILNLICKDGHKTIAWLLVLFPILLLFVLLGTLMLL